MVAAVHYPCFIAARRISSQITKATMNQSQQYKIWNCAVPSCYVRLRAVSKSLVEEYHELSKFRIMEEFKQAAEIAKEDRDKGQEFLSASFGRMTASSQRKEEILSIGEKQVRTWIRAGKVRAFAVQLPRTIVPEPVELPANLVLSAHRLDWDSGIIKHQGLSLVELRFLDREEVARVSAEMTAAPESDSPKASPAPSDASRPPGRPSYREDILAGYVALRGAGEIDFSGSMKSQYPKLRTWLRSNFPSRYSQEVSPGDEIIRRTINDLFKKDKLKSQ